MGNEQGELFWVKRVVGMKLCVLATGSLHRVSEKTAYQPLLRCALRKPYVLDSQVMGSPQETQVKRDRKIHCRPALEKVSSHAGLEAVWVFH